MLAGCGDLLRIAVAAIALEQLFAVLTAVCFLCDRLDVLVLVCRCRPGIADAVCLQSFRIVVQNFEQLDREICRLRVKAFCHRVGQRENVIFIEGCQGLLVKVEQDHGVCACAEAEAARR